MLRINAETTQRIIGESSLANAILAEFPNFLADNIKDRDSVAEAFASLHNVGSINLFLISEEEALAKLADHDFFKLQHCINFIIPRIDAPVEHMMEFVDALVLRGGDDLAANQPNQAFRNWCSVEPGRARTIEELAHEGHTNAIKFLTFALEATSNLEGAREFSLKYSDNRRLAGLTALGRICDTAPASIKMTLQCLESICQDGLTDISAAAIVHVAFFLADRSNDQFHDEVSLILDAALKTAGAYSHFQCASALWTSRTAATPRYAGKLLECLRSLEHPPAQVIQRLDQGLKTLTEGNQDKLIIDFVGDLLTTPTCGISLDMFPCFLTALLTKSPETFGDACLVWLWNGAKNLCDGLVAFLRKSDLTDAPLRFNTQPSQFNSSDDQLFICRKSIGYLFLHPIPAASIVVHFIRTADPPTQEAAGHLLLEHLLLNYSGSLQDTWRKWTLKTEPILS